jgi:hypothetical protein
MVTDCVGVIFHPLSTSPLSAASLEVPGAGVLSLADRELQTHLGSEVLWGPCPGEEAPASSKTAMVMGGEGGAGGPTHQAREDFEQWGKGLQTCWSK